MVIGGREDGEAVEEAGGWEIGDFGDFGFVSSVAVGGGIVGIRLAGAKVELKDRPRPHRRSESLEREIPRDDVKDICLRFDDSQCGGVARESGDGLRGEKGVRGDLDDLCGGDEGGEDEAVGADGEVFDPGSFGEFVDC